MKCENCGKNEVAFVYRSSVNGRVEEKHLCAECARKLGYDRYLTGGGNFFMPNMFNSGFFGNSMLDRFLSGAALPSGRDIDKVAEAGLTLVDPETNSTPGIREYPLTLECRVLYSQKQDLTGIPEAIRKRSYPQDVDSSCPMANRDAHIAYIGEIVDAYLITE